ncbi:MAG TPA: VWA domain-containing protein [Abditibacteriaceae bacterium]|jgi:Ca-activated chloride channel family protein
MSTLHTRPTIEIIPSRAAVCTTGQTKLTLMVRIVPPAVEKKCERPPLNIGLALDRSGSMGGEKLAAAKAAAIFLLRQLTPRDRVSVTVFDDRVETIVPSTLATGIDAIEAAINRVDARGGTDLHKGWVQGGIQVGRYIEKGALNRVILLTDGQANQGETNPRVICRDVRGLLREDISTSALGFGLGYNEDLLEAMAEAGGGNYAFVESERQLERIFEVELQQLNATVGKIVSLGLEAKENVKIRDVYNDLKRNSLGRLMLRNLIAEQPIEVVTKVRVEASRNGGEVLGVRLAWTDPKTGERHVLREVLSLPAVTADEWAALPENEMVLQARALLKVNRLRQRAAEAVDAGDYDGARRYAAEGSTTAKTSLPADLAALEVASFTDFDQDLTTGEYSRAAKTSKFAAYQRRTSRRSDEA